MRKSLVVLILVALAIALGTSVAVFTQLPAPKNPFTGPPANGCVDCHDGKIARKISAIMADWAKAVPKEACDIGKKAGGKDLACKHPEVKIEAGKTDLPDACLGCHKFPDGPGAKGIALSRDMHLIKYSTAMAGFNCTACHVLDLDTGDMKVKSGKEK